MTTRTHIRGWTQLVLMVLAFALVLSRVSYAQPRIAAVRPDAAAPGMSVVLEVLARATDHGAFGKDGLLPSNTRFVLDDARDSLRVIVGPLQVAWDGRLLQVPLFVLSQAALGPVRFHITSPAGSTQTDTFFIQRPQHLGALTGSVVLGDGINGTVTKGNTLVLDSLTLSQGVASFSLKTLDSTLPNRRYQPLTILSRGPVRLTASEITVSGQGKEGGPGGGGGGSGHAGVGGAGYTGGGNSSSDPATNIGSGTAATDTTGGASLTGIYGGESEKSDQGGGGGTGHPFGTSGRAGIGADTSRAGGFGGGSAGGEQGQLRAFGGGGGGFGTSGQNGEGAGANGGHVVGGRFLVPLAGGSGGGAGNALNEAFGAGSGGGGGGAIAIVTFDSVVATDALLSATGDSGTYGQSPVGITAGGGGGAGGAILIETARGGFGKNFTANASGGVGGPGGTRAGRGGDGGTGRLRVDGPIDNCEQCQFPSPARGISIFPDSTQHRGAFVNVLGVPSAPQVSTDTVRIFYRTRHSAWQFVDTIRYANSGPLRWSKWLPAFHDSLLFVAAYAQTLGPDKSAFNYEPDWIPSHVSLSTLRHQASPSLIVSDSIWLGKVRRTHCADSWLRVENRGELPLVVDSATTVGSRSIRITSSLPKTIAPYTIDSILVSFCPDSVGLLRSLITLYSNDSSRAVRTGGEGVERSDTLTIVPSLIDFGKVRVGTCDSIKFKGFAKGSDTVYIHQREWVSGHFTIRLLSEDTAIAPGDTARLIAYFCATDSGAASARELLSDRGDSLSLRGIGILRAFSVHASSDSLLACGAEPVKLVDSVVNVGNDTAALLEVRSRTGVLVTTFAGPQAVSKAGVGVSWSSADLTAGQFSDTLDYIFSDTIFTHVVFYRRSVISVGLVASVNFGPLCVDACDSIPIVVTNTGIDSLSFTASVASSAFHATDNPTWLAPAKSDTLWVSFCPGAIETYVDSLHVVLISGECSDEREISLIGSGTVSRIVLDSLTLDSTIVGECRTDSITISNPCGPDVTIVSLSIAAPFDVDQSQLPLTIPSRGHVRIAVTFCPKSIGAATSTLSVQARGGDQFSIDVAGYGYDTSYVVPYLAIRLTPITVIAGDKAPMLVELDSTNITGVHDLIGRLSFDPFILHPSAVVGSLQRDRLTRDTLVVHARLDLAQRGVLGSVDWLGLLGPSASTVVAARWDVDSLKDVGQSSARADVIDCSGLAGKVVAAGEFKASEIYPNPASTTAALPLLAGAEASISIAIYNSLGMLERQGVLSVLKGLSVLTIPTEGLPSGVYRIIVSVPGWSETRSLLLAK